MKNYFTVIKKIIFIILFMSLSAACTWNNTLTPTPVVAGLASQEDGGTVRTPIPTPEPFRFNLPTPGAQPISGWRPPLYPVPWSLTDHDHFYFVRPIAADQVNWPLATYRYGGNFFANVVHTGVDIPASQGTPIMAAGPGTVVWAGWGLFTEAPENKDDPYGLAVALRHDFGFRDQQLFSIYAHMSRIEVVVGQHLEAGELLGLVGSTGNTTGPHLHFEVRFPDNSFHKTYNPELWIAPPQGWGVLAGRIMDTSGKLLQLLNISVDSMGGKDKYIVRTYGAGPVNRDPYYQENTVLGDLPAGLYKITINFDKKNRQTWLNINPGQVTYFTFKGEDGFGTDLPPDPNLDFLPSNLEPSQIP